LEFYFVKLHTTRIGGFEPERSCRNVKA